MARRGKIARLPRYIRDELGERLENGEVGASLVEWLNSLSEVKGVMEEEFGGREVTEDNLSEWRQGGHKDWLAKREAAEQLEQLVEDTDDLEEIRDNRPLTDHLARLVTLRYAALLANKNGEAEDRHRVRALRALLRDIIDLRRSDLNAARVAMEQERWNFKRNELDEREEDKERSEEKSALLAPLRAAMRAKMLAEVYGGGEVGEKLGAFRAEVEYGLPEGSLGKPIGASGAGGGGKIEGQNGQNGQNG